MQKKRIKKTMIGGQALIEGLMMKGPQATCIAVRKTDGSIHTELSKTKRNPTRNIPFVRGVAAMVMNLIEGYKSIMLSADLAFPDEDEYESKFDKWVDEKLGEKAVAVVGVLGTLLGAGLALGLFVFLPVLLTNLLESVVALGWWKTAIEGVLKILIFLGYLLLVTRMNDIHRVFEYHGAEHKTIMCYEYGDELTVENVKKHSRFHPRCGTSFIFIVLLISIIVFSFVPWPETGVFSASLLRAGLKLIALPFVMGISYEVIMLAGKFDNWFCRILSAPGLWVQRLTTFEPDDAQIEVAITAFNAVLPPDGTDEG